MKTQQQHAPLMKSLKSFFVCPIKESVLVCVPATDFQGKCLARAQERVLKIFIKIFRTSNEIKIKKREQQQQQRTHTTQTPINNNNNKTYSQKREMKRFLNIFLLDIYCKWLVRIFTKSLQFIENHSNYRIATHNFLQKKSVNFFSFVQLKTYKQ